MDGWVMRVGELLSPIVSAMGRKLLEGDYIRRMKRRWPFRCTTGEAETIKLTFGNTVDPKDRSCSISGLGVKGQDPNASLEISKGSSKATATVPMIGWVDPQLCMQAVGRIIPSTVLS
jgi:hypothetical protein